MKSVEEKLLKYFFKIVLVNSLDFFGCLGKNLRFEAFQEFISSGVQAFRRSRVLEFNRMLLKNYSALSLEILNTKTQQLHIEHVKCIGTKQLRTYYFADFTRAVFF